MRLWLLHFHKQYNAESSIGCKFTAAVAAVTSDPVYVWLWLQAHEMPLAEPFESSMTRFQKLLVLRCLRPDRVLAGVRDFVSENLGQRFIEPPPFDLAACFKESSASTPLVFVLSPGTDIHMIQPASRAARVPCHLSGLCTQAVCCG